MPEPIGIPDKFFVQKVVGHCWGLGNNLAIFPTSYADNRGSKLSIIYSLTWETTLYNNNVRKLVNESMNTFSSVQSKCQNDNHTADLLPLSHQYRCIINACIDDLNQAADTVNDNSSQELQEMSEIFYKVELIWNLCEIVYLEKSSSNAPLPHLLEWIRIHFPLAVEMAGTVVASHSPPALHDSYWKAIYGLIFQLRIDSAIKLLKMHDEFQSDSFQSAVELLKKMPLYGINSGSSIPEFLFRWKSWSKECNDRFISGDFYNSVELALLVKILCGKEEAFEELDYLFETWYQKMLTTLIFTQPTINSISLAEEAERFLENYQGVNEVTSLDMILLAILRRDTRKMIGEMQVVLDNSWFSAHLADLLYNAGVLDSFEDTNCLQLRESLLRDYALCLFSHPSLWNVGIIYLDQCPTVGPSTFEQILTRLPCQSEYKAMKLLAFAENRNSSSISTSICRVMGHRALTNGRLGAAVSWAVRAQDSNLATFAADAVLKKYLQDSDFTSTDLLDSLGAGLLASDRLAFLGKYREFHRLYSKNDFHSSATLLVSLISSRIAPKYFWTVLLMDALPLLETNPPVFTAEQTYELMQSLQELTSSFQDDDESNLPPNCQLNADKSMLITLAMSRNLAKCFVQQSICD